MNIFKKWLYGKSKEKCQREAEEIYQLKEFDGEIWLTMNGALVCPERLLDGEAVSTLKSIRRLYVERNATDYDGTGDIKII